MSFFAYARRTLRGRKTIWAANVVLLLICLVLIVTDRNRAIDVLSSDQGSRDGRDRAKPPQPHKGFGNFVDRVAQRRGTSPSRNELRKKSQVPLKKNVNFCSTAQYANGTWQARKNPPGSVSDIRQLNSLGVSQVEPSRPLDLSSVADVVVVVLS